MSNYFAWFASADTEVKWLAVSGFVLILVGAVLVGVVAAALWGRRQERVEQAALREVEATVVLKRPPFGPGAPSRIPRWNNVTDVLPVHTRAGAR